MIEEDIKQLKSMIISHDWYYHYSDDHRYYVKGRDSWRDICSFAQEIGEQGELILKSAIDTFESAQLSEVPVDLSELIKQNWGDIV